MCGFVGLFDPQGERPISTRLLDDMSRAVAHRGPDDRGSHMAPGIALQHHRLAIVDTSGGRQPMCSADRDIALVFNGYLYNHHELRATLEGRAARFRTQSDTEVILQAWMAWGAECVRHLRGMFAFAIWDGYERTLFLARDPLGIKPLCYTCLPDGTIAFASDLRAFLRIPSFRRTLEPQAIEDYLALGYVPEPATLFTDTRKLPAGATLTLTRGRSVPAPVSYWKPWTGNAASGLGASQREEALLDALASSVQRCLTSDRRVGILLSGGVDSSAVLWAAGAGAASMPAFTLAVEHDGYDESRFAAMAADRCGADHRLVPLGRPDARAIDELAATFDEPLADSSALPTSLICRAAKREVSVVLSGDGGDELFAGYRRHRDVVHQERDHLIDTYFERVSVIPTATRAPLYGPAFRRSLASYSAREVLRRTAEGAPVRDDVELLQYLDLRTYMQGDILTKVDRMSMAAALEVRVPMLDHVFVDLAGALPTSLRLRGTQGKWILKKALEPHLPAELLYRPKTGFSVPIGDWLSTHLRAHTRDRLLTSPLIDAEILDGRAVDSLLRDPTDASGALWSLLMLDGYCRRYLFS